MTLQAVSTSEDLIALGLPAAVAEHFGQLPRPASGVLIYCDGACSGNGTREVSPGGWGVAAISADGSVRVGHGASAHTTNNKMELTAAIEGLKAQEKGAQVTLRTDSQYVIKGCTEWRAGWQRKGMKNSKGEAVANQDLWALLWAEVDARKVKFEWVKGHNGDAGNEIADMLAVMGRDA